MLPRPSGIVSLLTDYGSRDPYVGIVRGMVLRHHPKAVLVDLGHEVPAQDIAAGAFWLLAAVGRFPAGTVHVAVVDPGVGTARRCLAVAAHEAYWLGPDNGLLSHVLEGDPAAEVRELDLEHLSLKPSSRTFHGRDVFAPAAAHLAAGMAIEALGPRRDGLLPLSLPRATPTADGVRGEVYAHELVSLKPDTAWHYVDDLVRERQIPLYERFGWELAGAFVTAMKDDSEAIVLWAIPTWEQWAELEKAVRTDAAMRAWREHQGELTTAFDRFLLVDAPLSPFRTGRQPQDSDRDSYQLPDD